MVAEPHILSQLWSTEIGISISILPPFSLASVGSMWLRLCPLTSGNLSPSSFGRVAKAACGDLGFCPKVAMSSLVLGVGTDLGLLEVLMALTSTTYVSISFWAKEYGSLSKPTSSSWDESQPSFLTGGL